MNIGVDFDGTITAHPAFYVFLTEAWIKNGGLVYIITARKPSHKEMTVRQLCELGFGHALSTGKLVVHTYPEEYTWPYPTTEYERDMKGLHAAWKARVCKKLGIVTLYDDCPVNVTVCNSVGITTLHHPPGC